MASTASKSSAMSPVSSIQNNFIHDNAHDDIYPLQPMWRTNKRRATSRSTTTGLTGAHGLGESIIARSSMRGATGGDRAAVRPLQTTVTNIGSQGLRERNERQQSLRSAGLAQRHRHRSGRPGLPAGWASCSPPSRCTHNAALSDAVTIRRFSPPSMPRVRVMWC